MENVFNQFSILLALVLIATQIYCCASSTLVNGVRRNVHRHTTTLKSSGVAHTNDLSRLPYASRQDSSSTNSSEEKGVRTAFYTSYWTIDFLEKKWLEIATLYPETVKHEVIGKSVEGRNITALRIGRTSTVAPRRVLLNSLLHANEWASLMAATYAAERLAVDARNCASPTAKLLSTVEVLVVPLCNPDGYAYAIDWENGDPSWRKNRARSDCPESFGVDLNRNWPVDFGGPHAAARNETCSQIYPGPKALSEPETRALRDYIVANNGLLVHLDYNAYNQYVIGPYLHKAEAPPYAARVDALGNTIADAMTATSNATYRYSRLGVVRLMHFASGIVTDWTFERGALSYHVAMRPSSNSTDGYPIPVEQLLDNGREGHAAAMEAIKYASTACGPLVFPAAKPVNRSN